MHYLLFSVKTRAGLIATTLYTSLKRGMLNRDMWTTDLKEDTGMELDWLTPKQAAELWGITECQAQALCAERRISGVRKLGRAWLIPKDSPKPADCRTKPANQKAEPRRVGKTSQIDRQKIRAIIDAVPAACTFWDIDGTPAFCNQEAANLFGLSSPGECVDRVAELFPPRQPCGTPSREKARRYANEAFDKGRSQFDWVHQKTDGTPISTSVTITRIDWQGMFGLIGIIHDLRGKLAKDEVDQAYQKRLQLFIDHMPLGCSLRDKNFEIADCNQAVLNLFGMSSKEEYFANWRKLVPEYQPDGSRSSEKLERCMKAALETGHASLEWMLQKLDRSLIPAETTITRVKWQGEDSMVVFVRDLTDVYKYREMESSVKQRLHVMLDSSPLMCTLYDEGHNILHVNSKAESLLEIPDKQMYVDNPYAFFPKLQMDGSASREKCFELLQLAFEKGSTRHEWTFQTFGGKPIPCEEILERVKLGDKDFVIAYIRDLREEKEMLAKLEKALVKAQAASLAKGTFLSNMSHEIRTPINAIVGMTAVGKSARDICGKDYAFEKIESASGHLLGIINDILEMSKIEAGKFELHCQSLDFRRIIENTVNMLSLYIEEKRLKLKVDVDDAIPRSIIGDELRLTQVVTNLLTNAVKFTPTGGRIRLAAKRLRRDGGFDNAMRIEVSDTGIGISKEQQSRLFSAFEQAEAGITRKFGGTGLGLAISKRIVEAMGGNILIESELGKGAKFIFTVRFELGEAETRTSVGTKDKSAASFKGYRVLLVDDVDINREIVIALLESTGIEIECASNGIGAINMFLYGPERYDLILMDIQMPIMDGLASTRYIRASKTDWSKRIPIIAMTANVFQEDVDQCMLAGMNGHLGKPLNLERVMETLRMYLPGKPAGA